MKARRILALALVLGAGTGSAHGAVLFDSFEEGFAPWLETAVIETPFSVQRSNSQADDGEWSLNFTVNGQFDEGQVVAFRPILLQPGSWNVTAQFRMWSPSQADFGTWNVIGGISLTDPRDQIIAGTLGNTDRAAGFWTYSMANSFQVSQPTTIYVSMGLDVVYEVTRVFFFDSVTISGVPTQCGDGVCLEGETTCTCPADCPGPAPAPVETTCDDGIDDDCNGFTDCRDDACRPLALCDAQCDDDGFCEQGESCTSCPQDCSGGGDCCGDGICGLLEQTFCPWDCITDPCRFDRDCHDALFCNGVENCVLGLCFTTAPCIPPQVCDEVIDDCVMPVCDDDGSCEPQETCVGCPGDCDPSDTDGDGVCDIEDCAAADGSLWSAPGPVTALTVEASGSTANLSWLPSALPGAQSVEYDTLRSEDPADFVLATTCVETNGTNRSTQDGAVPLAGSTYYYLVRIENDCPGNPGSMGSDWNGDPRTGRSCP